MAEFLTLDDLQVRGKVVLVRVDFNVPMKDGRVTDATRLERSLPTLLDLARAGARVALLSHFGRPDGKPNPKYSLLP
ncbi:MAG: phosphoglycerate kinase, partial [Alphaproteobacteria bacterium]|nr:phosphoglycerate kinase [Alphaproteobacteria bacterium]